MVGKGSLLEGTGPDKLRFIDIEASFNVVLALVAFCAF